MFIHDSFTFLIPRIGSGNPASSSPKPGDQGAAMLFSYKNQCSFASCFGCFSNIPFPLRYVDAARALFPAMPACHALPPSPTNHASRHAPLFFPPVRHDTSRPITTSPSHPAGSVSVKRGFQRVHPSGPRDLQRQALLPPDQGLISEITAVLPA